MSNIDLSIEGLREQLLRRAHPRVITMMKRVGLSQLAQASEAAAERQRIDDVLASPDNAFIPRVPDAGEVRGDVQVMHNGLVVSADGYYGSMITEMLRRNRGVHEPQEERVFQAVIPTLPAQATFVELGAYWGFYSMWFKQLVPGGRCFLVEADEAALKVGRKNFELNGMTGDFTHALVGKTPSSNPAGPDFISLDSFREAKGIEHIDVLHADIQRFEHDMLLGAVRTLRASVVDWWFISTHTHGLHVRCAQVLRDHGHEIVASATPDESFSEDGVIVAKRPEVRGIAPLDISRRQTVRGLVRRLPARWLRHA